MEFSELRSMIKEQAETKSFGEGGYFLEKEIFSLNRNSLLPLVTEIGTIPENIKHDSTEEKLYAKVADIILAKCFQELGLHSLVNKGRANCADVVAKSPIHKYSLVGDAKAFRLSRTAKNQKDFKVKSMVDWREDHNYAVLVCPYYQYPREKSQIYKQARDGNVLLFSWEHLSIMLSHSVRETVSFSLSEIWNISEEIKKNTNMSDAEDIFFNQQNEIFCKYINFSDKNLGLSFKGFRDSIVTRGEEAITYWENEMVMINNMTRKTAIKELLKALKLKEKISSIKKLVDYLKKA